MTGLLKQGHNSNKGTFEATIYTKMLDVEENRKNGFSQNCKKSSSQILDMLFIELFWWTDHKNLGRGSGGTCPFSPRNEGIQNEVFRPFWGEKVEIQKFFLLPISHFLGPIDGLNNIFLPGLLFWLYSHS